MPTPDFKAASRRHGRDARYLLDGGRWSNADHLAGLAAECGLKAILQGWLGASLNVKDILVWEPSGKELRFHVNKLWPELPLILSGRSGPALVALVVRSAPSATWDVADRYSGDNAITEQHARGHVGKAEEIVKLLDQAELTGAVP